MWRHLKLLYFFVFLVLIHSLIEGEQLSKIEFIANSQFLSPNNDGFQDEILFKVILHQNLPIKVKEWYIDIVNYESKIVQSFKPQNRTKNLKEYTIVWNGREDTYGNYVPEGNYKAILKVYYDYGKIYKEYSLNFFVYRDTFNVELNFINPYLIKKWDINKKQFNSIQNEIKIKQIYKKDFSLESEFNSYILNNKNEIVEKRRWIKRPESITTWDGKINQEFADLSIYHYVFAYKSYEKQIYQYILPGIFVLPVEVELPLNLNPFIINPSGKGFTNNEYKNFEIYQIQKDSLQKYTPSIRYNSLYYQIFCYKEGLISSKWQYIQDGVSGISKEGIYEIIKKLPMNHYCQIVFYKNPSKNFDYLKITNESIISILPIYIDEQNPIVKFDIEHPIIKPDIYYKEFFQKIQITAQDNTFIKEVNINLFLNYNNKKLLIKSWKSTPNEIGQNRYQFHKDIYWYGDIIQNFSLESLEDLTLEVEVVDIANNKTILEKSFKTGVFFKEKGENYVCNIPLSKLLDNNHQIKNNIDKILENIVEEYRNHQKKYLYIKVHSDIEGNDEKNLYFTEEIAKEIYQRIIKKIPYKNVYYRGMGELYPNFYDASDFTSYRNNRLEIILSDIISNEEKDIF